MRTLTIVSSALALSACSGQEASEPTDGTDDAAMVTQDVVEAGTDENQLASNDDLLAGTSEGDDYDATTSLPCTIDGVEGRCAAGVKRNWMEEGNNLVEVTKPDGRKRAIFLEGTTPIGADSAQADGSAGWDFNVSRQEDRVTVDFGPESYMWVDAFVEGG